MDFSSAINNLIPNPNQLVDIFGSYYLKSFKNNQPKKHSNLNELSNIIYNFKVSFRLHLRIYMIEHILRRYLSRLLEQDGGSKWYDTSIVLHDYQKDDIALAKKRLKHKLLQLNSNSIQSFLPFGFWVGFFEKKYLSFWKAKNRKKRFFDTNVNETYIAQLGKDLRTANNIRNKIAHQVCVFTDIHQPEEDIKNQIDFLDDLISRLKPHCATSIHSFIRISES